MRWIEKCLLADGSALWQAMHLVYRAMEKEAVPASLPANLIPPSKRKKSAMALPGAVAVLPSLSGLLSSPVTLKETLLSSSPAPASASAAKLSPKPSFKSSSEVSRLLLPGRFLCHFFKSKPNKNISFYLLT